MLKDQFNVEIRMPRFQILTTVPGVSNDENQAELFKTTMTHHLTGRQMLTLLQEYNLLDWVKFAKILIKQRIFGVD